MRRRGTGQAGCPMQRPRCSRGGGRGDQGSGRTEWPLSRGSSPGGGTRETADKTPRDSGTGQRAHTTPIPEGVLTLRARPPSEAEFVDCFQKIKLAINLLVSQRPALPPAPRC